MVKLGRPLPILAFIVLAVGSLPTKAAEVLYLETVDWVPTARVLAVPTSYVIASSYVVPTTYAFPTVYATAYVAETAMYTPTTYLEPSYYETRFRRRGLFGRRLVETTRAYYMPTTAYYPTTYYYPTTFSSRVFRDAAVIPTEYVVPTEYVTTSSSACCGEVVVAQAPTIRSMPSSQAPIESRPAPPAVSQRSRPSRIESRPADEDSISSDVDAVPELPARESRPEAVRPNPAQVESPPAPQLPSRDQSTARPSTPAAPKPSTSAPASGGGAGTGGGSTPARPKPAAGSTPANSTEPPLAPAEDPDLQPAPTDTGSRPLKRDSQKPVFPSTRSLRSEYRNVLFGRVKSRDTNDPEDGVRVTLASRMNAYQDRVTLTDAFGRFAVKVPDGDWTVNVTMPSGRSYPVSDITVSNGLITDENGRDIPSLVITR